MKLRVQIPKSAFSAAAQRAVAKSRVAVREGLHEASTLVENRFVQEASKKLSPQGAAEYAKGLGVSVEADPPALNVTIAGELPEALEKGFGSFDMKPGFLASAKAKQSKKGGVYFDVPIKAKSGNALQKLAQMVTNKGKAAVTAGIRRVSANSAASSWIHPGFEGVGLFKTLRTWVRETVLTKVREHLKKG